MARRPLSRNTKIMIIAFVAFLAFVLGILAGMQNRSKQSGDLQMLRPPAAVIQLLAPAA